MRKCFLDSLVVLMLFTGGCAATPPARFYRLSTIQGEGAAEKRAGVFSIGVGPVAVPDYLNQPQIALRSGENTLSYSEFDRWAENLKEGLPIAMAENLSALLGTDSVYTYPWVNEEPPDCQVMVDVVRFEATPQGRAEFNARWRVLNRDGKLLVPMLRSVHVEQGADGSYPELVAALSRTVQGLSRDIAGALNKIRARRAS